MLSDEDADTCSSKWHIYMYVKGNDVEVDLDKKMKKMVQLKKYFFSIWG